MPQNTLARSLMICIAVTYILIAAAFAALTPAWQAPDEPAHYNYIAHIVAERRIPIIEMGDWDQAYLDTLRAGRFAPELLDDLHTVRYEDHQPPLYYLLAAPVYALTGGDLIALRLFSASWGLIIILSAYQAGRLMMSQRPWIGPAAAAFVAFLPQHVHILTSVNNDALGWAIVALTLVLIIAYVKDEPLFGRQVRPWHMGVMVGLGLVTKATTYFLAGVVPLAIVFCWLETHRASLQPDAKLTFPEEYEDAVRQRPYRVLLRDLFAFFVPATLLGALWWLRNISVYGFPDFLGLAAHDVIVVGQPRTAERIAELGLGGYLQEAFTVTFQSFWGQFGWMAVPLPGWLYTLITLWLAVLLAGLVGEIVRRQNVGWQQSNRQRAAWLALSLTALLSVLAYLYYNSEFQQYQGRYMFPLLIPLALWLALGVDAWRRVLTDALIDWGQRDSVLSGETGAFIRFAPWLTPLAFMPLALLNVWLLARVIIPNLTP